LPWLLILPFLVWAGSQVPWAEVWASLRGLSGWQLLALAGLNSAIFALFSGRWWLILRAQGYSVSYLALTGYRLAAFGITYFTPGPQFGGEPLQVYLVRSRQGVPGGASLAAVAIDKLYEVQANLAFLAFGLFAILERGLLRTEALSTWGGWAPVIGAGLLLLPAGYMLALWRGWRPLSSLAARLRLRGRLSRAQALIQTAEGQAGEFFHKQPAAGVGVGALSLLIWIAMIVEYWLVLRFLGLSLDPLQAIAALTAARLAFVLPSPAGIGTLEASQVLAMQALGAGAAVGVSASLLIRARDMSFAALGLWLGAALIGSKKATPATPRFPAEPEW
jgi:uncharacterized membrane protein YbhN (UPF0104 family)